MNKQKYIKFIEWYAEKFEMKFTAEFKQKLVDDYLHSHPEPERKTALEILNKKIKANKCHSIDPFEVFEKIKKSAIEAMQEYFDQFK